jgi:hypothetical protein
MKDIGSVSKETRKDVVKCEKGVENDRGTVISLTQCHNAYQKLYNNV